MGWDAMKKLPYRQSIDGNLGIMHVSSKKNQHRVVPELKTVMKKMEVHEEKFYTCVIENQHVSPNLLIFFSFSFFHQKVPSNLANKLTSASLSIEQKK